MRPRDLSIRGNLALLILFTSALAVLLASCGFAVYERHSDRISAIRELTSLADAVGTNTAASLAFNDQSTAEQMLRALATEPHIQAAWLYDSQDRPFAEYRRTNDRSAPNLTAGHPDGAHFDRRSLMLFRGVYLNGERTGTIALLFDLSEFRSRLLEYLEIAGLMFLISVFATFFVSLRLASSIGNPLVKLAAVAQRVSSDKDYSIRATIRAGGETGILVDSFNEMLSRIELREAELSRALQALEVSEERYSLAARGANDGLWDWNLLTGQIYFSSRFNEMLGNVHGESWSQPEEWFSQIHGDDRLRVRGEIAAHLEGKTAELASEYRMRHTSGRYIWMLSRGVAVRNESGKAVRMAGSQTDITEGKIADPLTHIPNRLYFIDRLEAAIEEARQENTHFAVLFIDLDGFKLVNDSFGHAAGDELLVDVAGRLRASIRNSPRGGSGQSVVARLGGDEFAMLVDHIQEEMDASVVATRILERLSEPFDFEGHRMFISASIGIAVNIDGATPEDLLRNADTAMYYAKTNGKGRFEFFSDGLRQRAVTRLETETGLRKAIDNHQLVLFYQPIVSLRDARIRGFEALLRWNHPERGLIQPGEFIPVAEESDLIVFLGRWVLRESCRQMSEWQRRFTSSLPLTINVNVSARQLSDSQFVEDVEAALAESGLRPESLALEMTEGTILGNVERTMNALTRLKSMKVRLEIDDFGTGYSSLSYLQKLPFETLKIDRSFIRELSAGNGSADIVRAILDLAHSIGLEVVAEGVETGEQLSRLNSLGCDFFQGFLISKPIEAVAAEGLLRQARQPAIPFDSGVPEIIRKKEETGSLSLGDSKPEEAAICDIIQN
jgi:diguanylate cyclase (GGDEF)-like protein/PAS domain S-box-containing protein